jgi:mono/diheme cytochrome c family protein
MNVRLGPLVLLLGSLAGPAFAAEATAPGLLLELADGRRTVTVVAASPHFAVGAGESLEPAVGPDFRARFTGLLRVTEPGRYRIVADGAAVKVGGQAAEGRALTLDAGDHPFELTFRRSPGPARLQVRWSSDAFAEEPVPVSAFVRPAAAGEARQGLAIERGRALVAALGCAACHAAGPHAPAPARGPDLGAVGDRTDARFLAGWLEDPRRFRAHTTMPAMLDAAERRDVAAYLAGRKRAGAVAAPRVPADAAARGKALFASVGCTACHDARPLVGLGSKTNLPALVAYLRNPLAVDPSGRMPQMNLSEDEAVALAAHLLESRAPAFERAAAAAAGPGDPARGKALVASRGCLSCHTLEDAAAGARPVVAPALAALGPGKGCLAPTPPAAAPRYALSADDRAAIAAYLATPDVAPAPAAELRRQTEALGCNNCHEIGAPARVAFEEVPPSLTEVGGKLRETWLREVLVRGKRLRPWMTLRMPHFGAPAGEALAPLFAAAVGVAAGDGERPATPPPVAVREGVRYLGRGEEGLACITCHDFGQHRSLGATRGPDMVTMVDRLRPDWFRRWLRNPGRIQPGTQMPAFFAGMPPEETERRIGHLWSALSLGEAIPRPQGLADEARALLKVGRAPRVFRAFMPEAAMRTLAVGFPGGLSYAYDLEGCRLLYAWQGEFLDVTKVWVGRGGEEARPLGRKIYVAPAGVPLRVGAADRAPVVRYRGYRLDRGVPELRYEVDGALVRERITPASAGQGLVRTFVIDSQDRPVWFVGDGKARHGSSAGRWEDGRLALTAAEARRFSVTITPGADGAARRAAAAPTAQRSPVTSPRKEVQ